jgi:uncharacterized protein YdbL (DUF1318 family)
MRARLGLAAALCLGIVAFAAAAPAAAQESAAELRSTLQVGERYDGFLGLVRADAPTPLRSQMQAINIRRRAHYTGLARRRGARVEEVAVAAGCEILASRVGPGQYYLLPDGVWRQRRGNEPVPRPDYCQ